MNLAGAVKQESTVHVDNIIEGEEGDENRENKRKRVSFEAVHVREYKRQYAGGGGVPYMGMSLYPFIVPFSSLFHCSHCS